MATESELGTRSEEVLAAARERTGRVLTLTGAGISAESGIPTFRGADGYWTVGSENYRPEEVATRSFFRRHPEVCWRFYLERVTRYGGAEPNPAHRALVELEAGLGNDFLLITQNVDGLHRRAGNSAERIYEIHGNIRRVRCSEGCRGSTIDALPAEDLGPWPEERDFDGASREALTCRQCGAWLRPHVLWFDECYDEENFRWQSSLGALERARLLMVVGTSGATTLPSYLVEGAYQTGLPLLVINQDPSRFSEIADASDRGAFLQGAAGQWMPKVVARLLAG